jgi:peptidoglycan/LPS O-acetylase OafA/YrhL
LAKLTYRPDIDGLRALAVLSVIFYHFDFPEFRGGFVGVDVFFVISGYLMTLLIKKAHTTESFSLGGFYENRVRRIFPALFFVGGISALLVMFTLLPYDQREFGKSLAATTLFASNVYFWHSADYFAPAADTLPLLHTWSLGVEEQFYLVLPLVLLLVLPRKRPWFAITALLALSLVLSIWEGHAGNNRGFFLLHARAWEFLIGSCVALQFIPRISRRWLKEAVTLAGLAALASSALLIQSTQSFPGHEALLPTIGTALLLHGGVISAVSAPPLVSRLLGNRVFTFTGKISYSLYLWHWPLFVIAGLATDGFADHTPGKLMLLGITFVLSFFTWKYIEQPFRRSTAGQGRVFRLATVSTLCGLVLGILMTTRGAGPAVPSPTAGREFQAISFENYLEYDPMPPTTTILTRASASRLRRTNAMRSSSVTAMPRTCGRA